MNRGSCWPNGSYFKPTYLLYYYHPIYCTHNEALDGSNDGGWILPSGDPCTSTTSPIRCTNVATDGPTNITLQRVRAFDGMELEYKCCLPNDCDNGPTDIIIANIYCKLHVSDTVNAARYAQFSVRFPMHFPESFLHYDKKILIIKRIQYVQKILPSPYLSYYRKFSFPQLHTPNI